MSPDLEWRVGDDDGLETIARVTSPAPSRWRKVAVLAAIVLGLGLGVAYASIPEPPKPPPTPTRSITTTPIATAVMQEAVSLDEAIRRDALKLANEAGSEDFDLNLALDDNIATEDYAAWYYALLTATGPWGRPMYTVEQTGTLRNGVVWANVRQFRQSNFFRNTRFYRREGNQWQPSLPDRALWGGQFRLLDTTQFSTTMPFDIVYPIEDEVYIQSVIDRFSHTLAMLCADLNCPLRRESAAPWPRPITLTVIIRPGPWRTYSINDDGDRVLVQMPSPRVIGVYDYPGSPGDPVQSIALDSLLAPATRLAAGDADRWATNTGGAIFLAAITDWRRVYIQLEYTPLRVFFQASRGGFARPPSPLSSSTPQAYYTQLLADDQLLPLEAIWRFVPGDPAFTGLSDRAAYEAEAAIAYIEQLQGRDGVIQFLNELGAADSLPAAIEAGLGIRYSQFLTGWLRWIGKQS